MQIRLQELRSLIREMISASPEYMRKEKVREKMQGAIASQVKAGKIRDQKGLERFLNRLDVGAPPADQQLALTALKSIPFEVWLKLSSM